MSSNISPLSPLAECEAPKVWSPWDDTSSCVAAHVSTAQALKIRNPLGCTQADTHKLSADAAKTEVFDHKNSVSVSIFAEASQKDNTHSAYSGLDSFLFSVTLVEILQQGVSRQQTKWKKGNRSRSTGGGWEKEERGERLGEQGERRDGLDLCDLCQG